VHAQEGKIDNLIRVLSFHPNFLKEFLNSYNYLMYSQGALSYDSRHYLALMAASRHKCIYLVKQQEKEFSSANGQKNWLMGLDHIPPKLKDLNEINKLLCHQPWLINEEHIAKLLKGQLSWSLTELIMAVTILTHFHAIAGFVFGSGINDNYLQQLQLEENNRRAQAELEKAAAAAAAAARLQHKHNRAEYDEDSDEELSEDECNDENYDKTRGFGSRSRASYRSEAAVFRTRSDSTGTANRTLSNSSASSCELGIDMLLKEMQMIQADDKSSSKSLNKSSSSLLIGRGAMTSPTASANLLSSSLQSAAPHVNLSSGTTTITNSPISSSCNAHISSYLTDLSNCANPKAFQAQHAHHHLVGGGAKAGKSAALNIHDNNNNKIDENEDSGAGAGSLIEDESEADSDECDEGRSDEHNDSNNNSLLKANNTKLIQDKLNNRKQQQAPVSSGSARLNTSSVVAKTNKYMLKYAYDPDCARLNFKNADQTLKLEYYTWDSQGFVTAYNIYPDICEFLDRNFKIAGNMTYNTMGSHKQVDTSLFRRAVWNYIHSLFGIHYDDYDYKQIKKLLGSPLRNYIKILCSCPERITKKDYDSIMKEFTHSEKVGFFFSSLGKVVFFLLVATWVWKSFFQVK
jgi:alkylhydroperoxidase family enzyme